MSKKRVLIFGVTGMLGHTLFKEISKNNDFEIFGTTRSKSGLKAFFSEAEFNNIRDNVDADNFDTIIRTVAAIQPDIIINCIGIIKQLPISKDPLTAITINAQFPHRLSMVARAANARMIHISTDCVFKGDKADYTEEDPSDATDLYGRTKLLGEVDYPNCVTLRTSIIGHELKTEFSLVDWFLSQENSTKGFTKAIYSGFPTIEIVKIITNFVIPNEELKGLYHVSSDAISKYELLQIISDVYKKQIEIEPFDDFKVNRSLNSDRFKSLTGYQPPAWPILIEEMYQNFMAGDCYTNKSFRKASN
ncbi:MAG: SDR family oxidoreductase [Methyloprofundus sp.]|nr:SDR family oxidoreductase [Methyloprofundus sp.]